MANTISQQEIIVKVDSIEINDKTDDVIKKLRKINELFEAQRKLTREKEYLSRLKFDTLARHRQSGGYDSFKDKSTQCRKIN